MDRAASASRDRALTGATIARRYRLSRRIGRGGHGDVWEAEDTLAGEHVAVKMLGGGLEPARVRKEVSTLRLLQIPGVVRLLDDGTHEGQQFLVMERVHGTAFPGELRTRDWSALAGITTSLLETLARIHAAGVVHRDIKPSNVLVSRDGRPVVLDFGLAGGALGTTTGAGPMAGTPAYMAPEQACGEEVTAAADLFALGVMLYEALAGCLPHRGENLRALLFARVFAEATPLREVAPAVPGAIAAVIDGLLARHPRDRPASATEVLRRLRGEPRARGDETLLPWPAGREALGALEDAVRAGRSVDLAGPRGSGRTSLLRELADRLGRAGTRVLTTVAGKMPLGSLGPVLDALSEREGASIDEVLETVTAGLRSALASGAVLIADDAEQLDGWTRRVLEGARGAGSIVRAVLAGAADEEAPTVHLRPLDEPTLRALFAGPERVFHLPSDAARALRNRTGAWPAAVADELERWVRDRIARRDGTRYVVDREALDRLAARDRLAPALDEAPSRLEAPRPTVAQAHLEDLLVWLVLAWPHTTLETLAAATGQPAWKLEAQLRDLASLGLLRARADGRWEPVATGAAATRWDPLRRQAARRALASALAPGTEGRLVHLVAGAEDGDAGDGVPAAIAREAVALAHRRAAGGELGQAIVALAEGLLAARRAGDLGASEDELLGAWVALALDDGRPRALDRVRYELCRAASRSSFVEHLERLVAAASVASAGGERGLDLADAVGAFADAGLELRRQGLRVQAARRCVLEREEAVVEAAERWSRSSADPAAPGRGAEWLGRLRYRQERYDEAAALFERAAAQELDPTRKLSVMTGAAVALIDGWRAQEAAAWAARMSDLSDRHRNVYYRCWAEYLQRSASYRLGEALAPDEELVDLAGRVGHRDLEALVCMTEAAVAWRAGVPALVVTYTARAHAIWSATAWRWGDAPARALGWLAGATYLETEFDALAAWAAGCALPRVGLQVLGMLGRIRPELRATWAAVARRMASAIPRTRWGLRMEVLSVAEVLQDLAAQEETAAWDALAAAPR